MPIPLSLCLWLNLLILVPVCTGLLRNAAWVHDAYGPATPARGILLSLYGSLAFLSAGFLLLGRGAGVPVLLTTQIMYKVTTPFTVGTARNPVVITNLGVAAFHAGVLAWTWLFAWL